jgi:hypothetical protein
MRKLAILAAVLALAPRAWAKGDDVKTSDDESSDEDSSDDGSDSADEDTKPEPEKPEKPDKAAPKKNDSDLQKQDLTGHDLGTNKKASAFEKDRFFVDKVDTDETEDKTLVQGSIATSAFYYTESGGQYAGLAGVGNQGPSRMFGDLRLQTDFRHISGGRWDARADARLRFVNTPSNIALTQPNHIQSGYTGQNEYDIRELWLIRSGKRSDVFLGRQYIPDLGGIKIDGLRIDYASSKKFTLIGFGGLYPLRGSRSLSTDYKGSAKTVAGGFGAAYRTGNSYGSLGGVTEIPLPGGGTNEKPRIYGTSSGYWRGGPKLDIYHFGLIDLYGSAGFQITNLSAGLNYKPDPRLRVTANVNRVDTETLAVQAAAFLNPVDTTGTGPSVIQNEAYIRRLSTNQARAGVSAGLGHMQRFEVSTALTYRYRPSFKLSSPDGTTIANLDAATSVDLWGGIIDRHSIKDARIGVDATASFNVGDVPYQRSTTQGFRLYVGHDLRDGRGDLEVEIAYTAIKDKLAKVDCMDIASCYGNSSSTLLSVGGETNYRINANWIAIGSLFVTKVGTQVRSGMMAITDPSVTSITGFGRVAYRF